MTAHDSISVKGCKTQARWSLLRGPRQGRRLSRNVEGIDPHVRRVPSFLFINGRTTAYSVLVVPGVDASGPGFQQ